MFCPTVVNRSIMKKILYMGLLAFMVSVGCRNTTAHDGSSVSLTVEETDDRYRITADYDPAKQKEVEALLDKYLRGEGDPSFANTQLDAQMTGNDKRTYHIRLQPGELSVKLNKGQNSPETLHDVQELGKALKMVTE